MKIASFNANGIRARIPILLEWIEKETPDVLCIQETKVQDPDFPKALLNDQGYHCSFKGEKSYNGVAILSKSKPEEVNIGFQTGDVCEEARLIMCRINGIPIVNTYVPQGQDPDSEKFIYKLNWLKRLKAYFDEQFAPQDALIWTGDFNIAPPTQFRAQAVYVLGLSHTTECPEWSRMANRSHLGNGLLGRKIKSSMDRQGCPTAAPSLRPHVYCGKI